MARKKIEKTYTEFMAWLEGVESMQSKDWLPNKDQWKLIRTMIGKIQPESPPIIDNIVDNTTMASSPAAVIIPASPQRAPIPSGVVQSALDTPPPTEGEHVTVGTEYV